MFSRKISINFINGILLALSSALLLILSFPKFDIEILAWVALIPLFIAIKDKSLKSAFGLSFLTGISFLMGIFYWINIVSGFKWVDFILLGIYLGSYFGLFGLLFNFLYKKKKLPSIVIAPVLWVSVEYLRSHAGFLGLPWALLGHSQYLTLPIIQISSFIGVYGVSFLIVMVNVALSELIQNRFRTFKPVIIPLLILAIFLVYGFSALSEKLSGDKVSLTVIQGNIPQDIKWKPEFLNQNMGKHVGLTKEAINSDKTSLIVWPEGSIPGPLTYNFTLLKTISTLAKESNAYLLIGSSQRPKFGPREFRKKHKLNSAFLISPSGTIMGQYNKVYLLPFAEYLPYRDILPWPSRWVSKADDFIPGAEYKLFNLNGAQFGVTICWENIFPELFRQFVKKGANFMINITNEAWFGETAAPYQFLSMSIFRAVENRVSVARSANTGISCFIDPYGRIIGKVTKDDKDIFVEGYLTKEIPLQKEKTFYTLYGDIFVYICIAVTIFMLGLSLFKVSNKKFKMN